MLLRCFFVCLFVLRCNGICISNSFRRNYLKVAQTKLIYSVNHLNCTICFYTLMFFMTGTHLICLLLIISQNVYPASFQLGFQLVILLLHGLPQPYSVTGADFWLYEAKPNFSCVPECALSTHYAFYYCSECPSTLPCPPSSLFPF